MKINFYKGYDKESNVLSLFVELGKRVVIIGWARRCNDAEWRRQFATDMLLRGCGMMLEHNAMGRIMGGEQIDTCTISREELERARNAFISAEGHPIKYETEVLYHHAK